MVGRLASSRTYYDCFNGAFREDAASRMADGRPVEPRAKRQAEHTKVTRDRLPHPRLQTSIQVGAALLRHTRPPQEKQWTELARQDLSLLLLSIPPLLFPPPPSPLIMTHSKSRKKSINVKAIKSVAAFHCNFLLLLTASAASGHLAGQWLDTACVCVCVCL